MLMVRLALGEVWEKDMSNEVYIEASSEGFVSVQLTCGKKRMVVEVEMEEDFDGVIYTRGSFMSKYYVQLLEIPQMKTNFQAEGVLFRCRGRYASGAQDPVRQVRGEADGGRGGWVDRAHPGGPA